MSHARLAQRTGWVDSAKGLAILLVVLFHAGRILYQAELIGPAWLQINSAIALFRMPLFFAASGLFLGTVLTRSWPELWRTRLSLLTWVFAAWVLIRFSYFSLWNLPSRPSEHNPARVTEALFAPINGLWFLHALVVFTVVAKLTARLPARVQLGVAALISVAVQGPLSLDVVHYERLGTYYVYFIGACLLRAPLTRLVEASQRRWLLPLSAALVLGGVLAIVGVDFWGYTVALGVLAIVAGFITAFHLGESRTGEVLQWFGARTLPIYVAHCIVIGAVTAHFLREGIAFHGWAQVWALPAVSVAAVALSLAVWTALRRLGFDWLYRAPSWFSGRTSSPCHLTALAHAAAEARRRPVISERSAFQLQ